MINATLSETVELNITAVDEGAITFQVINKPVGASWNQTGNMLSFYWPVASSQKVNSLIENPFCSICPRTIFIAIRSGNHAHLQCSWLEDLKKERYESLL